MKLGEKLKWNIIAIEEAAAKKARDAHEAELRVIANRRAERTRLIERVRTKIIEMISDGNIPSVLVESYKMQIWVKEISTRKITEDLDIWMTFEEWLKSEGLKLKLTEGHDGMGMRSWTVIKVEPEVG